MVEFMHQKVLKATKKVVVAAQYVDVSYDEISTLDN
jgi:hypothetical protein